MPTFTHGKAAQLYLEGTDLTSYGRSVTLSGEVDVAEASTFADDDKVYVLGMGDATLALEGLLDATVDQALNDQLAAATQPVFSFYPLGDSVGSIGYGVLGDVTSLERTAELGDVVPWSLEVQSSVGLDRMVSHHALAQRTASGTATVVDGGAATSAGGYGYVHATAVAGTVVLTVQDSADNVTFADLIVLGTLTASGGAQGFRTAVAGTVRRYTRLVYTAASGTATFVVGFGRGI